MSGPAASTSQWSSLQDWTELKEDCFPEVFGPLKTGMIYRSVQSGRTDLNSELKVQIGSMSDVMVPIRVGGRTWGCIGVDDCETERQWTESEVDALRAVSVSIAGAVERRDSATQMRTAELARANEALRRTADELARVPTIDDTIAVFLAQAVGIAQASAGAVLRRTAGAEFEFVGLFDGDTCTSGEALHDIPMAAAMPEMSRRDPVGYFARLVAGHPMIWKLEELAKWFPEAHAWQSERKHLTGWDMPFRLRGHVAGYLCLSFVDHRAPDALLRENVVALANQMALGFELTRLAKESSQNAIALAREKASQERTAEITRTQRGAETDFRRNGF